MECAPCSVQRTPYTMQRSARRLSTIHDRACEGDWARFRAAGYHAEWDTMPCGIPRAAVPIAASQCSRPGGTGPPFSMLAEAPRSRKCEGNSIVHISRLRHARQHARTHARTHARIHARTYTRTQARIHARTHTRADTSTHTHACTHVFRHARTHARMYTRTHARTHARADTSTRTHARTHVYTHARTPARDSLSCTREQYSA